ncbi:hypothetical protein PMAYCL1PPCAC_13330, partial [Pristionchus mayeri]
APEDVIVLHIQSPETLDDDGEYSPVHEISGFPWFEGKCDQERDEDVDYLGVYLHCDMKRQYSLWFCDVSYETTLVNQRDPQLSEIVKETHRFDCSELSGIGTSQFLSMDRVLNPNEGFIKDGMIIVEVKVTVNNSSMSRKFRSKSYVDLFSPSPQTDGILLVNSIKFYVNKQLIALQSPFFDRLFNGNFKESKLKEIPIEDVYKTDFENLIKAMYPIDHEYTDYNVIGILKLADKFEVNNVLDNAERFLMGNTCQMSTSHKLLLADKYKLNVLIDKCLSSYKTCAQIKGVIGTPEYSDLSPAVKSTFFEMLAKMCKC